MSNVSPDHPFAKRMEGMRPSFIREILKVTKQPDVISFAGGLPSADLFPVDELRQSADDVFTNEPHSALQYSATEGCHELRNWIADHYLSVYGLQVSADNILITNGSQQGLDLLGKIFLDPGDGVVIEAPAYLGALQSLSMYQPRFLPINVSDNGMDATDLQTTLSEAKPKLIYTVPDFQNPSGICYPTDNRHAVADTVNRSNAFLIEDSPYAELRYSGKHKPLLYSLAPEKTILLGSFSKTLSPSLRLGWVVANNTVIDKLKLAKQAADLHSSYLLQRIVLRYLTSNPYHDHIRKICRSYAANKQVMVDAIKHSFPKDSAVTNPEGGMFLWAEIATGISTQELFKQSIKQKVAFVPGDAFYQTNPKHNTMRLNYTSANHQDIKKGIAILATSISSAQNRQ